MSNTELVQRWDATTHAFYREMLLNGSYAGESIGAGQNECVCRHRQPRLGLRYRRQARLIEKRDVDVWRTTRRQL